MPTPRITSPTVATRPLTPTRDDGGAGVLGEVAQGVSRLQQTIAREIEFADEVAVNEAEVAYQNALEKALREPQKGVLQVGGTRALEEAERFRGSLPKLSQEAEAGLSADRQRRAFRNRAAALERNALAQVDAHAGAQMRRVDAEKHQALLAQDRKTIADLTRIGDAAGVDEAIRTMSARIATFGSRNGVAEEVTTQERLDAISAGRTLQMQALITAGNVPAAVALFNANKDQFVGEQRETVEKWVQGAEVTSQAQEAVRRVLAERPTTRAQMEDLLSQRAQGPVLTEARKILDAEISRRDAAKKADQEEATETAFRMMEAAGPFAVFEEVVPVTLRNLMTSQQRQYVRSAMNAPAQNNAVKWIEFFQMDPEDRAKLSAIEFATQYWMHFDGGHRANAERLYQESKRPDAQEDLRTFSQQLETAAITANIRPAGGMTPQQSLRYQQFIDLATREVQAKARDGRMGFGERQEIIDGLVREFRFRVDDRMVGRWEVTPDQRGDATVPYTELEKDPEYLAKLRLDINFARMQGSRVVLDRATLEKLAAADYLGDSARRNAILYPE